MKRKSLILLFLMTVVFSLKGNEVKLVRAFEMIDGMSVSLARSEWKKYLNPDAKVPMEYSIFKVRIKGNADAVKKAKSSFKLDLGSQLMVKDTYTGEDNEIWFLVPRKAKLIYLQCGDGCEKCQIWSEQIIPDKVYYGEVSFVLDGEDAVTHQYLVVNVKPESALVSIDGEMEKVEDGSVIKYIPFGRHSYRVWADDYHPFEGSIDVYDSQNKVVVNVSLDPSFGWINFIGSNDVQGASVYINDKLVGTVPMKTDELTSGVYDVLIMKSMYKPLRLNVTVNDNRTTDVMTELTANFANVTLMTNDSNAEIWVNDERKGTGQWKGRLECGDYLFETKKENHKTQTLRRSIIVADEGVIELAPPKPICGKIDVKTRPNDSEILLDGEVVGTTPMMIQNVPIGQHTVVVRMNTYNSKTEHVLVTEEQISTIEGLLTDKQPIDENDKKGQSQNMERDMYAKVYEKHLEYILDLNCNFMSSHGGLGVDFVLGYKLKPYCSVGGGLGFHSLLNEHVDCNAFATLYLNSTFYVPEMAFPMFDLALGCDLGMLGIRKPYYTTSFGLYAKTGIGFQAEVLRMSVGYEYLGTHTGYVKVGFRF